MSGKQISGKKVLAQKKPEKSSQSIHVENKILNAKQLHEPTFFSSVEDSRLLMTILSQYLLLSSQNQKSEIEMKKKIYQIFEFLREPNSRKWCQNVFLQKFAKKMNKVCEIYSNFLFHFLRDGVMNSLRKMLEFVKSVI